MQCNRCKRAASTHFPHQGHLCKICFCKEIELRIRRQIRADKSIQVKDNLLVKDMLIVKSIKRIIKYPITIKKRPMSYAKVLSDQDYVNKITNGGEYKLLLPWTLTDEVSSYLESIMLKKPHFDNVLVVKFFKPVIHEELKAYANLLNEDCKQVKKWAFEPNVDTMEKGLRGAQFSMLKASEKISAILKKGSKK